MATPALLTAQDCQDQVHLIIGSNALAASRCTRSLEVGARPILLCPANATFSSTFSQYIEDGKVTWLQRPFQDTDSSTLGRDEVDNYVDAIFVTLAPNALSSTHISSLCRRLRIPVNVADAPHLCTFTLLSSYTDGPLQIGITTSNNGCKLASRIRREIASALPSGLGAGIERLGRMRRHIIQEDAAAETASLAEDDDTTDQPSTFNQLIQPADYSARKTRRMRWLSQICEYYPLARLASITDHQITTLLLSYHTSTIAPSPCTQPTGRIILAGAGPGHPDLLTLAARRAISAADMILADKLVPEGVMSLIPRRTVIHIARKFPGNADAAQDELLALALTGLEAGQTVVRLKQGDPYLYGRGGEEVAFFRDRGYHCTVIPGITSALSATLLAGIPATHRSVADEVLICTGTGRKGAAPTPPEFVSSRTVVFLMALHRLKSLLEGLVGRGWPVRTKCAVVERGSCRDQRVIWSTLECVGEAVGVEGARPPGLLVVGEVCGVLCEWDRVGRWCVEEGFGGFEGLGEVELLEGAGGGDVWEKGDVVVDVKEIDGLVDEKGGT